MKSQMRSLLNYPRNISDNLRFRAEILGACEHNPRMQAAVREACRRDILTWIELFSWTKDPRKSPMDVLPFICYDAYQEEYMHEIEAAIDGQYDALTEKSRDMGATWMVMYVLMHKWLFEPGQDFRVGSRKEDYVDKLGDIDTILEKVRFNLQKQPKWMLPKGFDFDKHAGYMRIINPENSNAIVGESANEHFGSGGRRRALVLDEFAKWDDSVANAAWTSTADVAKCRLVLSTPVGSSNKFAQLASGTKERIKRLTLHWTLHPEKAAGAYYLDADGTKIPLADCKSAFNAWSKTFGRQGGKVRSPWYDSEAERRSEADLAQEVDIDYLRSGHPFFSQTALAQQKIWPIFKRRLPMDPIPYGRHIRARLVDVDHKIEIRDAEDGWLRIFEMPQPDWQYVVSADTSEGLAKGDEGFIVVRNKWSRHVVAAANGHYPPDDLAVKINLVAKLYNNADEVPENNNHGHTVCEELKKMDGKLYWSKREGPDGKQHTTKAGFTTDQKSRPAMLDQAEEEIRKNAVELRDEVLIAQCKTFVNNAKTGKPEADGDFLDDGVMAFAIGSAIIKELPYKPSTRSARHAQQEQLVRELSHQTIGGFSGR